MGRVRTILIAGKIAYLLLSAGRRLPFPWPEEICRSAGPTCGGLDGVSGLGVTSSLLRSSTNFTIPSERDISGPAATPSLCLSGMNRISKADGMGGRSPSGLTPSLDPSGVNRISKDDGMGEISASALIPSLDVSGMNLISYASGLGGTS
jgi:hypothetical protein